MLVKKLRNASGNIMYNSYIIDADYGKYLQVNEKILAFVPECGKTILSPEWDATRSNLNFMFLFLGKRKPELKRLVHSCEILIKKDL